MAQATLQPVRAPLKNTGRASRRPDLEVVKATLFRSMGVDGVYARTGPYEDVVQALKTTGDLGKMQRKREKEKEGERKDRIRKGSETEESKKLETEKERKRRKVGEK